MTARGIDPAADPAIAPMIRVRDLSIGWSRDEVLLEHASFEVRRGEIFGILGPQRVRQDRRCSAC